jgi:hypothetical protein
MYADIDEQNTHHSALPTSRLDIHTLASCNSKCAVGSSAMGTGCSSSDGILFDIFYTDTKNVMLAKGP